MYAQNKDDDDERRPSTSLIVMLMAAFNTTKTVAMVNVYLQPPTDKPSVLKVTDDTPQPITYPDSRVLLTHGFISRFGAKQDCLMLSLFADGEAY